MQRDPMTHRTGTGAESTRCGIFIPPEVCREQRLSPAARIVYAQVMQLTKKRGYCHASNRFLAGTCGLNRDTVSSVVSRLVELGLVTVEQEGSVRRIRLVKCGKLPHTRQAEIAESPAESIGAVRKTAEPCAENGRGHLNRGLNVEEREEEEDKGGSSSSSVSIPTERAGEGKDRGGAGNRSIPAYDRNAAEAITLAWGRQATACMGRRTWKHGQAGTEEKTRVLGIPRPAKPSPAELDQVVALALDLWPGSDPLMAFRQLLRATAWTSNGRDVLQQYAFLAAGGTLGLRAVLRIGGKEDPLSFAREAAALVPEPPPQAVPGSAADEALLQRLTYASGQWPSDGWKENWLEAAGRCRDCGASPQLFMAAVVDLFEQSGRSAPLPWIADSLAPQALAAFMPRYIADRSNAWSGGFSRADPQYPSQCPREYARCVGKYTAEAVAKGCTAFRNRSCLLCAAAELRLMPDLIQHVPWNGPAEELAAKMEILAARTDRDDPPIRGIECGQDDCALPSLIRCPYGNAEGVYIMGFKGDDPMAEILPMSLL